MADEQDESGFIKFAGTVSKDHTVPVDVLARTLWGLQQTLLLIGAADEPTVSRPRRFRASDALRRKCELRAGVSVPSSLLVPLSVQDGSKALLATLYTFLAAVAVADPTAMQKAIPDSFFRERAIQASLDYLPRPGEHWHVEFSEGKQLPIRLDQDTRDKVNELFQNKPEEGVTEVVADLVSLDFANEKLTVFYKPTGKKLTCHYPVDKEDKLYSSRRTQVKLVGLFERDEDGNPVACLRVDSVEPFDLSPFEVGQAVRNGLLLTLSPPLVLQPRQEEKSRGTILFAEDESLTMYIYARSRDDLIQEAENYIFFLWDAYAKAEPDTLDEQAQRLAEVLKTRISESPDGSKDS